MNVLVTGGSGFIGTHTILELFAAGHEVVAVDNFSNSSRSALKRVEELAGRKIPFYELDCRDQKALEKVFTAHAVDSVIHFAALKSVGESAYEPLRYYDNNVGSLVALAEVMQRHNVRKLIFSSSRTVYGETDDLPIYETSPVGINLTSPYGRSKFYGEEILRDVVRADSSWQVTALRYFNVVGAHASGRIGEDPNGIPNFLMPYIAQVAVHKLDKLRVFGSDYDTPDGTCIRDYIHVVDLAKGHIAAMTHLKPGFEVYNLGLGKGVSVLEMIRAFEKASGRKIPYEMAPRRPGDDAAVWADASKANRELQWKAEKNIEDACQDIWRWQSANPNGYDG